MGNKGFIFVILFFVSSTYGSRCYSDFCHTDIIDVAFDGPKCLLTPIERSQECVDLKFYNFGHLPPPGMSVSNFKLSAYVDEYPEIHTKLTAFNFTAKGTDIHRLVTRYQEMVPNPNRSNCRHIQLSGYEENSPELYVSCPFSNSSFEGDNYKLEYLVAGSDYEFSRKLIFKVPDHVFIDKDVSTIKAYTPFFYVDVSDINTLTIYIQPVPEKFNVSHYKVWLINNDTKTVFTVELASRRHEHLQHNFSFTDGIHYFKVAAMHPECGEYGCLNTTSPAISTKHRTRRLLIMIISVVWIPPVILYGLYYIYKLFRSKDLMKRINRKPNCLLVYSPTHLAHIDVMSNLAKYLRACNINAMIDCLDIPNTDSKDPGLWCNAAFEKSDVVVIATSPSSTDSDVPAIYRNVDNHILRLIKENYPHRNKKYLTIELPYCKAIDVPEEARVFKRLIMPENLEKFVRYIYHGKKFRFFGVSSKELIDSINTAVLEISMGQPVTPKNPKETDDLLPVILKPLLIKVDKEHLCEAENPEDLNLSPRSFVTNINELNLLGNSKVKEESINYSSPISSNEFRIDQLDL